MSATSFRLMTMRLDAMSFSNQARTWKSVDSLMYLLLVVASAEDQENDIGIATEDDQQQLRNLFIVIHFRNGGSISCLNTQHDTWNLHRTRWKCCRNTEIDCL
ncbi:hypothetical protein F511_33672 [Dorcoceras hygrometricum]|uniref:Uncharacterized protein n=1 Tax=Dorcoceras hygrometricum TaxID=472368 RepID=A0A2Z7BNU8_9LAMI|nr:hypothetical protein F511_33672 [Dorcoceras hygrometricum]